MWDLDMSHSSKPREMVDNILVCLDSLVSPHWEAYKVEMVNETYCYTNHIRRPSMPVPL